MAHGYRTLQHWDQWLAQQFLGSKLLEAEELLLKRLLKKHFGKHALLIGVPHQYDLLKATLIPCHSLITPLVARGETSDGYIESDFHELPILTGSIDLVLLPHILEFVDNPRQLLAEACRIIKPEGLIAICGFNPYSLWGLKKTFSHRPTTPWSANFIHAHKVKRWIHLAEFEMEKQTTTLFRPPFVSRSIYDKLHFIETIGSKCFPLFGGVYVLLARAVVTPFTPIKLKWKQRLDGIRIAGPISGHIARQSK